MTAEERAGRLQQSICSHGNTLVYCHECVAAEIREAEQATLKEVLTLLEKNLTRSAIYKRVLALGETDDG